MEPARNESPEESGADLVAVLYILGGIPAMALFFVLLFVLVHLFGIPA